MESLQAKIEQWLQPKLGEMNCYLVDVRVMNGGKKIEVYIDNNNRPVTIAECEAASRFLEFYLDNDGSVMRNYNLEVSSPGMENPFKVPQQYEKNKGRWVEVLLLNGIKKEGILKHTNENGIAIEMQHPPKKKNMQPETETLEITFTEIKTVKKKITF
jgi:ribosome maturation factor RimP